MKSSDSDRKVFRGILRAVASEDFSIDDYKAALGDLRSGEIVAVLENVIRILSGSAAGALHGSNAGKEPRRPLARNDRTPRSDRPSKSARKADQIGPNQLFDDIRRRKITRQAVENYISSLDRSFAQKSAEYDTMRSLLHAFKSQSGTRDWELLYSWVNGDYEKDPYMQRIVEG